MPTNDRCPILPLLLLLVAARSISSQPLPPPPTSARFSPSFTLSAAIIFITLIFAFFFLSFFSVYIRRCAENHLASSSAAAAAAENAAVGGGTGVRRRGLDPEVLESLPTMVYAAVKGIKTGKGPLECAICLSEFESDEETLRLLPGCCHVFHAECIDPWFASHVTCPVCRSNLSDPAVLAADRCLVGEEASIPPDIGVSVESEEIDVERPDLDRISRRRSQSAEGEDRYTLRLPEHVRMEIEEEVRHRRAASLAGMASSRRGNGQWSSSLRTVSERRKRGEGEAAQAGEGSCKRIFPLNGTPIGEHSGGGGENVESANAIGSHPERYYAHTVTLTGFVFQGDVAASDWNPDIFQVNSISALIKEYGWREIVPICEDTDFGRGIIPFIIDALQEISAHVPYGSVIPVSLTNDQTMAELYKLMTMRTRVFIVHMSYSMGSILFSKAKEAGMMSKGYAWIMTDALANIVDSIVASTIIYTMQGASGVKAVCTQIEGA